MYHVALPRVLPQECSEKLQETESALMNVFVKIAKIWTQWMPPKTLELLLNMRKYHNGVTPLNVWMDIKKLSPGENFAMFIRQQHCAIMIHVPPNETEYDIKNVVVAAFPGRVNSSEIYRHDSDIEVIFYPL